jgi:hypothetical protein
MSSKVPTWLPMVVTIKHGSERFSIEIDASATVRALKREIAKRLGNKISEIKLILDGHVLRNADLLSAYNLDPATPVSLLIHSSSDAPPPQAAPESPKKRPVRPPPEIPPGFGGFHTTGPGPRTEEELDQEFYVAISKPEMKQAFNRPAVHNALNKIYEALGKIPGTTYLGVIERLKLVPELVPDSDYEAGLARMLDMGFSDQDMCLDVLRRCNGDVDDAVEWLIENDFLVQ